MIKDARDKHFHLIEKPLTHFVTDDGEMNTIKHPAVFIERYTVIHTLRTGSIANRDDWVNMGLAVRTVRLARSSLLVLPKLLLDRYDSCTKESYPDCSTVSAGSAKTKLLTTIPKSPTNSVKTTTFSKTAAPLVRLNAISLPREFNASCAYDDWGVVASDSDEEGSPIYRSRAMKAVPHVRQNARASFPSTCKHSLPLPNNSGSCGNSEYSVPDDRPKMNLKLKV